MNTRYQLESDEIEIPAEAAIMRCPGCGCRYNHIDRVFFITLRQRAPNYLPPLKDTAKMVAYGNSIYLAFASLLELNLVEMKLERTRQAKRPAERWFARA